MKPSDDDEMVTGTLMTEVIAACDFAEIILHVEEAVVPQKHQTTVLLFFLLLFNTIHFSSTSENDKLLWWKKLRFNAEL